MEQVRAHWRRLYATYMNADAIIADLESCARHLTDGDKWEPNPIADGLKPMEMAEELDDDSGEPSAHGPYTRYSLQPSKRSHGSRNPAIPLRSMRGTAPCISRMSDRSAVWNGTSGWP